MARESYTGYAGPSEARRKAEQSARDMLNRYPAAEGCTIGHYEFDRAENGPVLVGYDAMGRGGHQREDFHADV